LVSPLWLILGLTLCYSPILYAEEDWGLCSIAVIKKQIDKNSNNDQPTYISANFLDINHRDAEFRGNVIFKQQPNTLVESEHLFYNSDTEILNSQHSSVFTSSSNQIKSSSFLFENIHQRGEFNQASLQFLDSHRFSRADKILQINQHEQQLENFEFTTCEPNDNAWALSSSSLSLNYNTGLGIAKHAKIYLFDIPIFYFPYFQFPIDDKRHSGLLMPSFSLSTTNGNAISVPIYWNIHPQLDSTIELQQNSQRGLQINTQNRYLTEKTQGQLLTSNLDDRKDEKQRYFYQLSQQTEISPDINLNILAQTVSDQDFFTDFNVISLAKKPDYLERHVTLNHTSTDWNTTMLFQNHQILDDTKAITSRPYEQLPKLSTQGHFKLFNDTSLLNIDISYIDFYKDNSVKGQRLIFNPSLTRRWSNDYSFIQPKLSYFSSRYHLTQTDQSKEDISLNLATFSLDSGLSFERIAHEENGWLQTLEPRLFYLQTPFKQQSHIPDFDTANLSSSYSNLFQRNRFTGGDRIGDTQQLTFGLSSRLLDINSGRELFRVSLGQTFFADDRQVQLNGTSISTEHTSDLFLELASQPNINWKLSANITRQAETGFITQQVFKASRKVHNHIFNFSYRFKGQKNNTELEQTDVSLVYPVNSTWSIFAKRQYSLFHQQTVEQLIGTSYDSCCWTFSIIALESSDDDFLEFDRSIYFQLTLKGLSNLGQNNKDLLSRSILGYQQ